MHPYHSILGVLYMMLMQKTDIRVDCINPFMLCTKLSHSIPSFYTPFLRRKSLIYRADDQHHDQEYGCYIVRCWVDHVIASQNSTHCSAFKFYQELFSIFINYRRVFLHQLLCNHENDVNNVFK